MFSTIRSAADLRAGDHVSWPAQIAPEFLRHHAIVVKCISDKKIEVMHVVPDRRRASSTSSGSTSSCSLYQSCSSGSLHSYSSYSVRKQTVDISQYIGNGSLGRYMYAPRGCNKPKQVIRNARSKLGKFQYNALNNNCEHYARWCKTDKNVSLQAETAKSVLSLLFSLFN